MSVPGILRRRRIFQAAAVISLLALYAGLFVYLRVVLGIDVVYSHAAYLPIVLASIWWGRWGLVVTGIVACLPVAFQLLGTVSGPWWTDVARLFFFLTVGVAVSELSKRVRASQQALRISENNYRLLVEKSLAGILVYRQDKILLVNSRLAEMLGREPETLRALAVWDLLAEEDRERVRQRLTQPGEQGPSDLQCECRLVRRDGTTIWVDLLGSAAEFNGRAAVLVNVYDITGRKQADAKRRELTDLARIQGEQLIHAARLAELGEISAVVAHELNQPLTGINNFASNAGYMLEQGVGGPGEVQENLRRIKKQVKRTAEIISQIRQMARKSPPG